MVSVLLKALGAKNYGIWVTIYSIVGWASISDFGLGNGLRNKLALAFARGDTTLARTYVSTAYGMLSAVTTALIVVAFPVIYLVDWEWVLGIPRDYNQAIWLVVEIVLILYLMRLVLNLITVVLLADQRPAKKDLFEAVFSVVSLFGVTVLSLLGGASLLAVALVLGAVPVIGYVLMSFFYYRGQYAAISPTPKRFDVAASRGLVGLSARFFVVQVAFLVVFATDNIMLAHLFGPEAVSSYSIALKYFTIPVMIIKIVSGPLWSAFTEAYAKEDIDWIRGVMKKVAGVVVLLYLLVAVMFLMAPTVYSVWLSGIVTIPNSLNVAMAVYALLMIFLSPFSYFLNGLGRLRVQFMVSIFEAIVNIPLSLFFAVVLEMGMIGIIIGTICSLLLGALLQPYQYWLIVTKRDKGIWST